MGQPTRDGETRSGQRSAPGHGEGARGFTLIELVIVLAIVGITALIGIPALQRTMARAQLEGAVEQVAVLMRQARIEAIRRSAPAVVVFDVPGRRASAFLDLNDAVGAPASDLLFNPQLGVEARSTDYEIGHVDLPRRLVLGGPSADPAAIDGLTDRGAGPRAVFQSDGSVSDVGGFRIAAADRSPNYLEVRVSPAASGRVQLRKWRTSDSVWHTRGMVDGRNTWEWYP